MQFSQYNSWCCSLYSELVYLSKFSLQFPGLVTCCVDSLSSEADNKEAKHTGRDQIEQNKTILSKLSQMSVRRRIRLRCLCSGEMLWFSHESQLWFYFIVASFDKQVNIYTSHQSVNKKSLQTERISLHSPPTPPPPHLTIFHS